MGRIGLEAKLLFFRKSVMYKIILRSSDLCGNRSDVVVGYSEDKEDLKMEYAFFELIAIPIEVEDSTAVKEKAIDLIKTGRHKDYV